MEDLIARSPTEIQDRLFHSRKAPILEWHRTKEFQQLVLCNIVRHVLVFMKASEKFDCYAEAPRVIIPGSVMSFATHAECSKQSQRRPTSGSVKIAPFAAGEVKGPPIGTWNKSATTGINLGPNSVQSLNQTQSFNVGRKQTESRQTFKRASTAVRASNRMKSIGISVHSRRNVSNVGPKQFSPRLYVSKNITRLAQLLVELSFCPGEIMIETQKRSSTSLFLLYLARDVWENEDYLEEINRLLQSKRANVFVLHEKSPTNGAMPFSYFLETEIGWRLHAAGHFQNLAIEWHSTDAEMLGISAQMASDAIYNQCKDQKLYKFYGILQNHHQTAHEKASQPQSRSKRQSLRTAKSVVNIRPSSNGTFFWSAPGKRSVPKKTPVHSTRTKSDTFHKC